MTSGRVLHLLCPRSADEEGVLACAATIASEPAWRHDVLVLGTGKDERRAWRAGVDSTDRITPLLGRAEHAGAAARRWARTRVEQGGRFDVVHAWCQDTMVLGCSLRGAVGGGAARTGLIRHAGEKAPERDIVCVTYAEEALGGRSELDRWNLRLIRAPQWNDPSRADKFSLRVRWGIDPDALVVALIPDSSRRADAMGFAFVLGLTHVALANEIGRSVGAVVGVVGDDVAGDRRGARFTRSHGREWGLVRCPDGGPDRVRMADVCVFDGGEEGGLPGAVTVGTCRAAGVPLIVPGCEPERTPPGCIGCVRRSASVVNAILSVARGEARVAIGRGEERPAGIGDVWAEISNVPMRRAGLPDPALTPRWASAEVRG